MTCPLRFTISIGMAIRIALPAQVTEFPRSMGADSRGRCEVKTE
jgi:hypothetical protein